MTFPTAQQANTLGGGGTSTSPFITHFANRDPLSTDLNFPISKRWVNTLTIDEFILMGYIASNGVVSANWQPITSTANVIGLVGNSGGTVFPTAGLINVVGDGTTIDIVGDPATSTLTVSWINQITTTQYDVLCGGPSNTIVSIGPGTANYVFLSGGNAAYPAYSTTFSVNDSTSLASMVSSDPGPATQTTFLCQNTATASGTGQGANIICSAHSSGSVADTGYYSSGKWDTPAYWNFGMTSTASAYANAFNISYAASASGPASGTVGMSITTAGATTFPSGDVTVKRTLASGGPQFILTNLSTTVGATARQVIATAANGSTSDSYTLIIAGSGSAQSWEYGVVGASKNFEFQAAPGNTHTYMDGTPVLVLTQGLNVGVCGASFGSGSGVIFIANATTNPTTNPVGGGILYVDAGALMYRGSGGTVTPIAPA